MYTIAIISSSIRTDRKSHRVALYFEKFLRETQLATPLLIDLKELDFPVMPERLKYLTDPPENVLRFSEQIKRAHAVIVVSPEYNSGYPASLKNAIDLLYEEWHRKPIAISTASSGNFGGMHALIMLQTVFLKIRALVSPVNFPVPVVQSAFDEKGVPADKEKTDKRATAFLNELLFLTDVVSKTN